MPAGKRESPVTGKRRAYCEDFTLDLQACIYCELCVQVCPEDAIIMLKVQERPGFEREDLVLTMDKLYANEKEKPLYWGTATKLKAMQDPKRGMPKPEPKAKPAAKPAATAAAKPTAKPDSAAAKVDGPKAEGSKADGAKPEGSKAGGSKAEEPKASGSKPAGAASEKTDAPDKTSAADTPEPPKTDKPDPGPEAT